VAGKPVIGIINTWSDINACHGHLRARAEDVKRGVCRPAAFRSSCRRCRSPNRS
jgi:dihydroxyacid dehydratase/phosphogluconate dehydratase